MIEKVGTKLMKILALLKINRVNTQSEVYVKMYLNKKYEEIPQEYRTDDKMQDLLNNWEGPDNHLTIARKLVNDASKYYDAIDTDTEVARADNLIEQIRLIEEHLILSDKRELQIPEKNDHIAIHAITVFAGVDKIQYGRGKKT